MENKRKLLEYLRQEILPTTHCPGCGCGQVLNAFVNAIHDLDIDPKDMISVTGIGCSSWIPSPYLKCDTLHTTHGRAVAFATGVKVMKPEGPSLHPDMLATLFTGFISFTLVFFALFLFRYGLERTRQAALNRDLARGRQPGPEGVDP